ncbi:hypothetical protein [Streptomyces sp. NPDC058632]|uniref:hypothetical protein n=1 Tax=Streptomyces sp. NPDC058632 TaxID=3346567 RepID=UPI00365AA349
MSHIIYDAGALIAAVENDRAFLHQHYRALGRGEDPRRPGGRSGAGLGLASQGGGSASCTARV